LKFGYILLPLIVFLGVTVVSAQSVELPAPVADAPVAESDPVPAEAAEASKKEKSSIEDQEAERKRERDDAALSEDPESARRFVQPFRRHGDKEVSAEEPPLRLYGSVRIHAIRNGTEASEGEQREGFSLGDGGSRVGARAQWTFGENTQLFGRVEAGFNIFKVFSSNASSGDGDEGHTLNPRLYYVGIDSQYLFLNFGKNWSTYYKIAGMTDRFMIFGGSTAGVYNAGTDGGASGTGRANEVLQTRLYLDVFDSLRIKPFNLNLQYQRDQPIPGVDKERFGDQYGASAWFDTQAGWGFGVAYNLSIIENPKAPAIVAAGLDSNDEALALSTRWSGDHWYASAVWTRQDNHETNDQTLYVDGNGVEFYAQWEFLERWWLVGGGNWFRADDRDPQAGLYEVDKKIIGLRRTIDSFNRMFYMEYQLDDSRGFAGDPAENAFTIGFRWDFGYGEHRPFEVLDPVFRKAGELL
jgi:predicted porin